jgi:hypothetical protein
MANSQQKIALWAPLLFAFALSVSGQELGRLAEGIEPLTHNCVAQNLPYSSAGIVSSLDSHDCQFGPDRYADAFTFSGIGGSTVGIGFQATFSIIVYVYSPTVELVTSTAASTGNSAVFLLRLPMTGQYAVAVTSLNPFATGSYSLLLSCQSTADHPCTGDPVVKLQGNRFSVRATWRANNQSGVGAPAKITADSAHFWFFSPNNVELIVKVLDGRAINGRYWVFYGALSNVEYTITVTDTLTGRVKTYFNPNGRFGSVGDTEGFSP